MKGLLVKYQQIIKTYPLISNTIQTATLMAAGDVISQTVIEKKQLSQINLERTARFASVGLILVGPALSTWYRFLSKTIGEKTRTDGIKKMLVDQFCFAPCFIYVMLFSINVANDLSINESKRRATNDYLDVLKNNYRLWPAVQLINFSLIPLQYQVIVVQIVAIFWNTYISWKTQNM